MKLATEVDCGFFDLLIKLDWSNGIYTCRLCPGSTTFGQCVIRERLLKTFV